ncbi:MAG TPA: AraC family transcriptional regulator, partial [Pseudoxanthomonas sp.]|nr:AraC family transcriptional regulator [Pseudoxanthomonas sp.]
MQTCSPIRSRHAECIDRALAHLSRALTHGDEVPDLAELARVAHFSPFHFHRVYRALTGETVGRSVARLRLLRALRELGVGAWSADLARVAPQAGYATPQALSPAFRETFDDTRSALRRPCPAPGVDRAAGLAAGPAGDRVAAAGAGRGPGGV